MTNVGYIVFYRASDGSTGTKFYLRPESSDPFFHPHYGSDQEKEIVLLIHSTRYPDLIPSGIKLGDSESWALSES